MYRMETVMWASVCIVCLLEVAENDFVFHFIWIYGEWKIELLKNLIINPLKRSTEYSSTDHSTFILLIFPAIPVSRNMQLYIQPNIQISLYCSVFRRRVTHITCTTGSPLHLGEWPGLSIPSSPSSLCRSLVNLTISCPTGSSLPLGGWLGWYIRSSCSSSYIDLVWARYDRHQQSSYQNGVSAGEVWG